MKENCFDIGTIQAFLDGELASDRLENVARHLSLCDDCAIQLATAEEESAFAYTALEQEFNTLVPTQRLWTKINDSIERERKPFWQPILAFFRNPALATFAAFLIVFGLFVAYLNSGNDNSTLTASVPASNPKTVPVISNPNIVNPPDQIPASAPQKKDSQSSTVSATPQNRKGYQVVEANINSNRQKSVTPNSPNNSFDSPKPLVYEYLPGEESYIKTIATLEKTVDDKKDTVLKPSSRLAFEKDLALVNDAISKMQAQVKKNPKNEAAKQVLLASYENKIDLLNSVAGKTELMASLR
ncbi:MAG: zf-HC2 domain-containing protein [Pyrinomonadaceae bacterium]